MSGLAHGAISGRTLLALVAALAILALTAAAAVSPAEGGEPDVRALRWAELVPPRPPEERKGPRPFWMRPGDRVDISGVDTSEPAPPPIPEGRWMSRRTTQSETPTPVVKELDGKRVRLGGYVVPLDFEATRISEFLLVPFVGACIHVPPPPANQIVYVKVPGGFRVNGLFEPVFVTGAMSVAVTFTGLAEAGYTIEAEAVEIRTE